ncbi:MAG: SHOCT domain-containing protein [bacterium]
MRARARIRPSKWGSALVVIVGSVFVCIGVFMAIPALGPIGIIWTLLAVGVTGYHALNLFSDRGVAHEVVEFDTDTSNQSERDSAKSTEERLKNLDALRQKGLVSEEEYRQQRKRILDDM